METELLVQCHVSVAIIQFTGAYNYQMTDLNYSYISVTIIQQSHI